MPRIPNYKNEYFNVYNIALTVTYDDANMSWQMLRRSVLITDTLKGVRIRLTPEQMRQICEAYKDMP